MRDIDLQTLSLRSDRDSRLSSSVDTHGCACTLTGSGKDLFLVQNSLCLAINPI